MYGGYPAANGMGGGGYQQPRPQLVGGLSSQSLVDRLDGLLNAVPYKSRPRVKQDIVGIFPGYSPLPTPWSLVPKVATHVTNEGNDLSVVVLEGTVQIRYMNAQYNIPIEIVIPDQYPQAPPIAFVRPTSTMEVKPGHSNIDANGNVNRLPYLRAWSAYASNLRDLCMHLSTHFSAEPPLFSRPARASATNAGASNPFSSTGGGTSSSSSGGRISGSGVNPQNQQQPTRKQQLIKQITEQLQRDLDKTYTKLIREKEEVEDSKERLKRSQVLVEDKIKQGRIDLQRIKTLMLDLQNEKTPQLEKWTQELEATMATEANPNSRDFESYMFAYDELSEQIISLEAEERACDDAVKCLSEAFDKGLIPLADFLRETREIASAQFIKQATMMKITWKAAAAATGGVGFGSTRR